MALSPQNVPTHGHPRGASSASSSWGGLSSMLRPAATERRLAAARTGWWAGMSRMLRAAGANPKARPLHAVLACGDLSPGDHPHMR
jgi:hypothetical protein